MTIASSQVHEGDPSQPQDAPLESEWVLGNTRRTLEGGSHIHIYNIYTIEPA